MRPRQGLAELADVDQSAGYGLVDGGFLAGCQDRLCGHWAAVDVFDLVGDGAASLGLQQAAVHGHGKSVEVGDAHERVREARPDQIPGCEGSECPPWMMHAIIVAGSTDSSGDQVED